MADRMFQLVNPNGQIIDSVSADQLERMTVAQFANLEGNLYNVRHNRRYDTAVWKANAAVTAETHKVTLFRKGVGEQDTYGNDPASAYTKSLIHTNMLKSGEFEQGDLVIIKNVEIEKVAFGGKPTTRAAGIVTNAKATFPSDRDPAMENYYWLNQLLVQFRRGNTVIVENQAINFPQDAGILASFGANSGAYAQNGYGANLLPNVQVLAGGDDFSVVLNPLANFDLTNTSALGDEIATKVVLETIELRRVYA